MRLSTVVAANKYLQNVMLVWIHVIFFLNAVLLAIPIAHNKLKRALWFGLWNYPNFQKKKMENGGKNNKNKKKMKNGWWISR